MKDKAFQELLTSVRQAGRIRRGTLKSSRTTKFRPTDVKAVRAKLGASQAEFALSDLVGGAILPRLSALRHPRPRLRTRALRRLRTEWLLPFSCAGRAPPETLGSNLAG